jgi:transcriptional regulator with XRE-family HTH domain
MMQGEAMRKKAQAKPGPALPGNDDYGFPNPGRLIKQYREKLTYPDQQMGKLRHWTQADLAKRLGVSEITVRQMENTNKGLDSIERRRILADILKIPPALLGLATLPDILGTLTDNQTPTNTGPHTLNQSGIGKETINLYQEAFQVYHERYESGSLQSALPDIERWIERIGYDANLVHTPQKTALLRTLWDFHILSTRTYCYDLSSWIKASDHVNRASEIALTLNNPDLQIGSIYYSGALHFAQQKYALAKIDLDSALSNMKDAHPQTQSAVLTSTALATALLYKDAMSITYAQKLLDKAEGYVTMSDKRGSVTFGKIRYLVDRADALICLGRPFKALEYLDDAESLTDNSQRRELAFLNLLRAECYIKKKRPEYDQAVLLLKDVFEEDECEFHLDYVERLYKVLAQSSYGNSPDVADLGMMLRARKQRKN